MRMKRIYLIFAVVLFVITQTNAQFMNWTLVNTGTTDNSRDVSFINRDTGFIAGDNGLLKMTTNGGTSWTDLAIPPTGQGTGNNGNIKVAQFYPYAGSIGGVLFYDKFTAINRTYDLGTGWTEECGGPPFFSDDSLCSINNLHLSANYEELTAGTNCLIGGGVVGYFGGFCFTFDSLRSDTAFNGWSDITSNSNGVIVTVGEGGFFANAPNPWTFTLHNSGSALDYLSVDWSDTSTVYAANNSMWNVLEKSTDGGNTFVIDSTVGPTFWYPVVAEIDFTDNDWGVMACASNGTGGVIITKKGNTIDYFNADTILTSAFVWDSTYAFAGGLGGTLYKFDKTAGLSIGPTIENISFSIFPNPQNVENDVLNLFVEEEVNEIAVYDITGKLLLNHQPAQQGNISLNTGIRSPGTYLVRIFTDKGVGTRKYVVN